MFENILVAVDGSQHSQRAEDIGIGLAKLFKGKVTALNVADIGSEYKLGDISGNIADEIVEGNKKYVIETGNNILKQTEEKAKKEGIPFQGKMIEGHPATEIMKLAEDSKMDLIVIGSLGITGMKKYLLGSVTESVIRHSKVPVLVVY